MNLTGQANYSKETVGLRQSDTITDQQFKLIYAYPLLFSDKINSEDIMNCRKFQTFSYLREIIVSNSLNIVRMASQINPDSAQPNNVAQLIGNAVLTGGGSNNQSNIPVVNQSVNPYEVQRRVDQKTQLIKKYLNTDPRTKKLLPYVEVITLNNLLDVPLIVGTKGFTVFTDPLLYILTIAIVSNTPLNKISNVEAIIKKLKNTKESEWFEILTSLTKSNETFRTTMLDGWKKNHPFLFSRIKMNRFGDWFLKSLEGKLEKHWYTTLSKTPVISKVPILKHLVTHLPDLHVPTDETQEKKGYTDKDVVDNKELEQLFNILKITKNNLDDVLLNFRFVLDPSLLKNQIGLDTTNNTMESTVFKLSSNQRQIFMQMHDKFMELISTPGSLFLNSAYNSLYPAPSEFVDPVTQELRQTPVRDLNFLELKEKYFDVKLNKTIQDLIFDAFSKEISNSLSSISPKESQERILLLKSICQSMSKIDEILEHEVKTFMGGGFDSGVLASVNFNERDLNLFTSRLTRLANTFGSMNKRFENVFSQLVNSSQSILKKVQTAIYSSLEDFFRDITDRPNYTSMMTHLLGVDETKVYKIYIPQITDTLFIIFYFFFLYRLQTAICQFVSIIDIELESKVNDVFDFPNYTLVLPIDIVFGVYSAYVAGSFEKLLDEKPQDVQKLNDNYVKGIIKFIVKRLKVPSIIVVDERRGEYHYQFMYMSAPEKISATSLQAFLKSGGN